ncbi:MAG TPA: hypothetical protein VFE47_18490 [Tepidisphaeraceae bacterium]|jgi:hypothetical protein|nr:hypothetical protein [Tepidisphaeraceae bacterium]
MHQVNIEKRLSALETRISELQRIVDGSPRAKDWRRSIGTFTDDPAMQQVLAEAQQIPAADRARVRRRAGKARA